jgi:hypothetical protein
VTTFAEDEPLFAQLLVDDAGAPPTDHNLFLRSGEHTGLHEEIRLARARLARAVAKRDDKGMQAWLATLHALVRVQAGMADGDESELSALLARVGSEVVAEAGQRQTMPMDGAGSD